MCTLCVWSNRIRYDVSHTVDVIIAYLLMYVEMKPMNFHVYTRKTKKPPQNGRKIDFHLPDVTLIIEEHSNYPPNENEQHKKNTYI